MPDRIIRMPAEVTSGWLAAAIDRAGIGVRSVAPIGTGQMSQSHRVTFVAHDGAEGTVVVKLASRDPTSRATGVGMGAYEREISFYRNLAGRIGGPLPRCHLAEYDPVEGWFTLVLEDIVGARQGDQVAGCAVEEARLALRALARVHAPVLGDLALGTADWLNKPSPLNQALLTGLLPGFLERYGERMAPEHAEVCERFVASIDGWAQDRRPPLGLVHGDYRLDNLLFGENTCAVVDWQTVGWGPVMLDAAYFIGGGLTVEDRRTHERDLVTLYHDELLAHGVKGLAWEQCWEEYRRQSFHGTLMTVAASMVVVRTDRGDDMFMTWLARNAQQIIDLDALSLLPAPGAGRPPALRPDPHDEGRHDTGPEALWNESWYFDAISDSGDLGLYVRIGRVPNEGLCLYTACVCGPGRPSIMLVDAAAPLPPVSDDAQAIHIDGLHAEHHCLEPLQRFRVTLEGTAHAHADASAPLRGESGEAIAIALDLEWETDGIPYAWRQSTRYEIPCRVTGTVRVGEEDIPFSGPGQRDHSWGARDWWAVDWMWSALHFDDGTRTHAVGVPQMPGYGVGYVQQGEDLMEIESVTATEEVSPNELITRARIVSGPEELAVDVEPVAYGAIRLEAPDGRLSFFPRAMCRVTTDDGRGGTGWVEWNRVQGRKG
jgi:Phosphotransferase enzyme family